MAISLTNGVDTLNPTLREGYDGVSSSARTVVLQLVDGGDYVSLQDDTLRAGRLPLLFTSAALAWAAFAKLRIAAVWTLTDPTTGVGMTFVREGSMSPVQQESRKTWLLEVGFREVSS